MQSKLELNSLFRWTVNSYSDVPTIHIYVDIYIYISIKTRIISLWVFPILNPVLYQFNGNIAMVSTFVRNVHLPRLHQFLGQLLRTFWRQLGLKRERKVENAWRIIPFSNMVSTLPKTKISPENRPGPKRKLIFQPSIFRCENVSFREGKSPKDRVDVVINGFVGTISWYLVPHFRVGIP